jgi:hypothetical protein
MLDPVIRRAAAAALLLLAALPATADNLHAIRTQGQATLTMCRSWVVYSDCRSYNHIAVPGRIAVGDTLGLDFGSNPKEFSFPVARIVRDADRCTIYSEMQGEPARLNRIVVEPCQARPAVP